MFSLFLLQISFSLIYFIFVVECSVRSEIPLPREPQLSPSFTPSTLKYGAKVKIAKQNKQQPVKRPKQAKARAQGPSRPKREQPRRQPPPTETYVDEFGIFAYVPDPDESWANKVKKEVKNFFF